MGQAWGYREASFGSNKPPPPLVSARVKTLLLQVLLSFALASVLTAQTCREVVRDASGRIVQTIERQKQTGGTERAVTRDASGRITGTATTDRTPAAVPAPNTGTPAAGSPARQAPGPRPEQHPKPPTATPAGGSKEAATPGSKAVPAARLSIGTPRAASRAARPPTAVRRGREPPHGAMPRDGSSVAAQARENARM